MVAPHRHMTLLQPLVFVKGTWQLEHTLIRVLDIFSSLMEPQKKKYHFVYMYMYKGSVAEWLARPTRGLEVVDLIPDHAMLQMPWESNLP
ncbi:hypothetical protein ElyMa_002032000 [Elysia marginata]|uniref:Uncharacterized protein n=1 Tax=Elysia marginata TaxID=1093978 RepID=A0AAV4F7V5_9GAST|nr:hypothetical protein ElyMa_002032000 [Elysia marginata]